MILRRPEVAMIRREIVCPRPAKTWDAITTLSGSRTGRQRRRTRPAAPGRARSLRTARAARDRHEVDHERRWLEWEMKARSGGRSRLRRRQRS